MLEIKNKEDDLNVKLPTFIKNYYYKIGIDGTIRIDNFPNRLGQLKITKNGFVEIYHDKMSGYKWAIRPEFDHNIYCLENKTWANQGISISDFFHFKLFWRVSTSNSLEFNAIGTFNQELIKKVISRNNIKILLKSSQSFPISFYHINRNDIIAIDRNTIYLSSNDENSFEKILALFGNYWLYVSNRDSTVIKFK